MIVHVFDSSVRFLDMPIVNIGTARNLFDALKLSLSSNGLDFSKCLAFTSDTTNVMKGARSGMQKVIRNECPHVLDVPCICHLAHLAVKAEMHALPVDIDQPFIDVFYYFYHSSKRKQEFCDLWCSLFTSEPQTILKHCPTRWLSLLRCVGRYVAQFDGLRSFLLSCPEAEVVNIFQRLEDPLTNQFSYFFPLFSHRWTNLTDKSTQSTTYVPAIH